MKALVFVFGCVALVVAGLHLIGLERAREIVAIATSIPAAAWVGASFLPIAALVVFALWQANQGDASTFKMIHLVTSDTGRGSKEAFAYTTIAIVCIWAIWAQTVMGKLTEWLVVGVLGAFVAGAGFSKWTQYKARTEGAKEPEPDAGDLDAVPEERKVARSPLARAPTKGGG